MPVACYLKKDAMAYLTGSRIALHFRAAARVVRPNISKDDEKRHSAHLMSVWACVLLTKQENCPITSKSVFVGWETPFECICVICTSSRTSIARLYGHHPMRLWTLSAHSLPTYFVSASCPRRLLARRKIWGHTRMKWIKKAILLK